MRTECPCDQIRTSVLAQTDMKGKSPQLHTGAVHKQKWHRRTKMESRKFVSLLSDFHLNPICNDKEGTEN